MTLVTLRKTYIKIKVNIYTKTVGLDSIIEYDYNIYELKEQKTDK